MSARLIAPHGGSLVDRYVPAAAEAELRREAEELPSIRLERRELADLLLLAEGALSPLRGYQTAAEVESVIAGGRLPSGLAWTIPISLPAKGARAAPGGRVALRDEAGALWAVVEVSERFRLDLPRAARAIFGTEDPAHPGVAIFLGDDPERIAGEVWVFKTPAVDPLRLSPREVRAELEARGFAEVAAFQTRNPLHRSHEYLLRVALEVSDGLLLHPLVGDTKGDDVPASVRVRAYQALVEGYLPRSRVLLATLDTAMRYAGPAEAIHHAILRQNYGASRLIVGRDHAGVGRYYGPFEAQERFDVYDATALAIRPLKLDLTFWCERCGGAASPKTCPHPESARLSLSGTEVRRRLSVGERLPETFTRPEVAQILEEHYQREARLSAELQRAPLEGRSP